LRSFYRLFHAQYPSCFLFKEKGRAKKNRIKKQNNLASSFLKRGELIKDITYRMAFFHSRGKEKTKGGKPACAFQGREGAIMLLMACLRVLSRDTAFVGAIFLLFLPPSTGGTKNDRIPSL
jgi:hypothetical protein